MAELFNTAEKLIIRAYKRRFGATPADWKLSEIQQGTSSWLDWSEWIRNTHVPTETICAALDTVPDQRRWEDRHPPLARIKSAAVGLYMKQQRCEEASTIGNNCPWCRGSGLVYLIIAHDPVTRRVLWVNPAEAHGTPGCNIAVGPCNCRAGDRENRRKWPDGRMIFDWDAQQRAHLYNIRFARPYQAQDAMMGVAIERQPLPPDGPLTAEDEAQRAADVASFYEPGKGPKLERRRLTA